MARKLKHVNSVVAQIKIMGQLAAQLDRDPRTITEVFEDFFAFTPAEREVFMVGYNNEGDDRVDDPIR